MQFKSNRQFLFNLAKNLGEMKPGFTLITETPLWYLALCIIAGAIVTILLYYRNKDEAISLKLRVVLIGIRFLAYTVLAFLLLNPLVKRFAREKELPLIVLAVDNSESMLINSIDKAADAAVIKSVADGITKELEGQYDVEVHTFGEVVSDTSQIHFGEKETDMGSVLTMIENSYAGRNTGAVIYLTDGIYNKGFNPSSMLSRVPVPVYTASWGDTTVKRDLILAEANYNRIAYLGNNFPLEIVVKGMKCNGLSTRIVVKSKNKTLISRDIDIIGEQFSKIIPFTLNAEKEGIMDLDIYLEPVDGEVTLVNNRVRAFIEVLTAKRKVLLLATAPHPDLAAMKGALESSDMIETDVVIMGNLKEHLASYDLVVFHLLPEDMKTGEMLEQCMTQKVPIMIIGGGKTRHDFVVKYGAGPSIAAGKLLNQHNEAIGVANQSFSLFTQNADFVDQLSSLPPLIVPFGKYQSSPGEQIFIYQKIKNINTGYPLISFYQLPGQRTCFIAGEGLWKWRIFSYRNTKSHRAFDAFFNQMVQYLTANEEKSQFRVTTTNYIPENESVVFNAELYNAAYMPVVEPEVNIEVVSDDGKKYEYTFSRRDKFYHLEAGRFPVGEYNYKATTLLGTERFNAIGKFVVAPVQIEAMVTRANHSLLRSIAIRSGGISVETSKWKEITNHIKKRDDIKTVSHLREKFTDLTSLIWLLIALLVLFGTEWFLRKWTGSY